MKFLLVLMTLGLLVGCGDSNTTNNNNSINNSFNDNSDDGNNDGDDNSGDGNTAVGADGFISVASGTIHISSKNAEASGNALTVRAPTTTTTVTYSSAEKGTLNLDVGSLTLVESLDENTLEFGSVTITKINVNKLKICGVGGDEKCTQAIIRIYSTELPAFLGMAGLINTTDGYGVDVYSGVLTATEPVGLDAINAAIVQSYTIPANDKKLTGDDFTDLTYVIEADFSNAGFGDYEMDLVIEVAVAL